MRAVVHEGRTALALATVLELHALATRMFSAALHVHVAGCDSRRLPFATGA